MSHEFSLKEDIFKRIEELAFDNGRLRAEKESLGTLVESQKRHICALEDELYELKNQLLKAEAGLQLTHGENLVR